MTEASVVRVGTRGSALAKRQTEIVLTGLRAAHPDITFTVQIITTKGDAIRDVPLATLAAGEDGIFTSALETALLTGNIDLAVHSLKDLPTRGTSGLIIGAIPERGNPADVLISRNDVSFDELPYGAIIGTGSPRRAAQLLRLRPDLIIRDLRGNVDTRIRKATESDDYDGAVLAAAGLERLGRLDEASEIFALDDVLPAPGQAALAVQCRDELAWRTLLATIHHAPTAVAVNAERDFLHQLGAGCSLPVAAYGIVTSETLRLHGRIITPNGEQAIDLIESFALAEAGEAGGLLAYKALTQGAAALLEGV